jgi:hypothetical protein
MFTSQEEFEKKYHYKKLKFTPREGVLLGFPEGEYICTACLWKHDPDGASIMAVAGKGPGNWITIHMAESTMDAQLECFEVLPDDSDTEAFKNMMAEAVSRIKQREDKAKSFGETSDPS